MLLALDIRDMIIIDRLELAFKPGLNALTGETGAGKSILIDALGFVLGWRGRAELVRPGADEGEVTAEFALSPGHPARAVLQEAGLPASDTLLLRRVNARDGRKTAWVNDRRVSGEVLRRLSATLVELHGQGDDRGLLNAAQHRRLLDAYGGLGDLVSEVRRLWRAQGDAEAALAEAETRLAELAAEEDYLRHAATELSDLAPQAGEDAALDLRRRAMQAAERVREDVEHARQALGHEGAETLLRDAGRWISAAAERLEGVFDEAIDAIDRAAAELAEAEDRVTRTLDALDHDPGELERTEERLFAIRALARKHGVAPDDLGDLAADFAERLATLDAGAGDIADLRRAAGAARAAWQQAADRLSAARRAAADRLGRDMARELPPLKLDRAIFTAGVEPGEPGPDGSDRVEFLATANPGLPPGPIARVASGGELSRFLLALKVCLTEDDGGRTLIFDEIDRGVGGATADAVGRRLAALAEGSQVLVVTHSPQVAARAGHHWRVTKRMKARQALSEVVPLDDEARVDELARMLSGERLTDAAREAARALLTH